MSFKDNIKKSMEKGRQFFGSRNVFGSYQNYDENAGGRYSSFWFDEDQYDSKFVAGDEEADRTQAHLIDAMRLSGFRRAVANFVHIMTGNPDIRVMFSENDDSYTDGKTVTISGDINNEKFDSTVGLALHESSHIIYTEFEFLKRLLMEESEFRTYVTPEIMTLAENNIPGFKAWAGKTYKMNNISPEAEGIRPWFSDRANEAMFFLLKDIINWIEDRRIDNLSFVAAPGYRPYYAALYSRYWTGKEIEKMVKSEMYRDEAVDSYVMRMMQLLNEFSDNKALQGLQEIETLIDYKNISRLRSTSEVAAVASQVLRVIFTHARKWSEMTEKNKRFEAGDAGADGEDFGTSSTLSINPNGDDLQKILEKLGVKSEAAGKRLIKALGEISRLNRGMTKKKNLDKKTAQAVATVVSSGATLEEGGGEEIGAKVGVVVIRKIDDTIAQTDDFSYFFDRYYGGGRSNNDVAVEKGMALGAVLGKKIQIRNEERSLKFTRQGAGRVDRRLVSGLGYDSENIFSRIEVDKYSKCHVHITIDASGSMAGEKFHSSLVMAVAMAKACTMVKNLECVISFRTITRAEVPVLLVGYDSRINKLSHIRKYFGKISANGSTPESLLFDAVQAMLPVAGREQQVLVVNLSDGEPGWSGPGDGARGGARVHYGGRAAEKHCRRLMREMRMFNGAAVLAYFITNSQYDHGFDVFQRMYGAENSFRIRNDSVVDIARTLNKKFLEAGQVKVNE